MYPGTVLRKGGMKCSSLRKVIGDCGRQRPCRYGQPFPMSFKWIKTVNTKHRGTSRCHHRLDKNSKGRQKHCPGPWRGRHVPFQVRKRWPVALVLPSWEG